MLRRINQVKKPSGASTPALIKRYLLQSRLPLIKKTNPATTFSKTCTNIHTPMPTAIVNPRLASEVLKMMSKPYTANTNKFIPKNFNIAEI